VKTNPKYFSDQLNKALDEMGMPINAKERAEHLSKMLDIPKPQAWNLLQGSLNPSPTLLELISTELEVDAEWLTGK
jgi:hypothetical protein